MFFLLLQVRISYTYVWWYCDYASISIISTVGWVRVSLRCISQVYSRSPSETGFKNGPIQDIDIEHKALQFCHRLCFPRTPYNVCESILRLILDHRNFLRLHVPNLQKPTWNRRALDRVAPCWKFFLFLIFGHDDALKKCKMIFLLVAKKDWRRCPASAVACARHTENMGRI